MVAIAITINLTAKREQTRNPQAHPLGLPLQTRRTLTQPNPDWGIATRTLPKSGRLNERATAHTPNSYPAHKTTRLSLRLPSQATALWDLWSHGGGYRPRVRQLQLKVITCRGNKLTYSWACSLTARLHHTALASPHKAPWLGRSWRGEPSASRRHTSGCRTCRSLIILVMQSILIKTIINCISRIIIILMCDC